MPAILGNKRKSMDISQVTVGGRIASEPYSVSDSCNNIVLTIYNSSLFSQVIIIFTPLPVAMVELPASVRSPYLLNPVLFLEVRSDRRAHYLFATQFWYWKFSNRWS